MIITDAVIAMIEELAIEWYKDPNPLVTFSNEVTTVYVTFKSSKAGKIHCTRISFDEVKTY